MSNTVLERFIVNGIKHIIVKYDIIADGSGDLLNASLFKNSSAFNQGIEKRFLEVEYELNGFNASLSWFGDPSLRQIVTMEEAHHEHVDWEWFGGDSNGDVAGATGDIYISTLGLGSGDRGYIILHLITKE